MSTREAEKTFEVIVFGTDGKRAADAEAATPEDAVFAGQTLYDEALAGVYGQKLSVGFYVDGKLIRLVNHRPEGTS